MTRKKRQKNKASAMKPATAKKEEEFGATLVKIKNVLGDRVKEVKLSKTLTAENPSCIVVDDNDPSYQMMQMMRAMGQDAPDLKPILEVNADHPIVSKLKDDDSNAADVAEVLLDQAMLIAGAELKNPNDFVKALNNLLSK